jgi:hypothetical protein
MKTKKAAGAWAVFGSRRRSDHGIGTVAGQTFPSAIASELARGRERIARRGQECAARVTRPAA